MTSYCYNCGHLTPGEPFFCNYCGRSYDVKRCPRLHSNPRGADVCSKCGSRDLSTPQPKVPSALKLLAILIRLGLGLLLFYATLSFLVTLSQSHQLHDTLVALGLLLLGLWLFWSRLPEWLREALRFLVTASKGDGAD